MMTSDKSLGYIATELSEDRKKERRAAKSYYEIDQAAGRSSTCYECRIMSPSQRKSPESIFHHNVHFYRY
jgi:hypothetical protein